ncbi:MACPF domain-containing CAD1-like protein [Gossypium australe]|uniref:MACPF domain-containing CAD1-like protein n=1 Tax=Gossypium australe TaxID=47621 RepID=A0A5B6U9C4_9ROSI|nr:MACPF domain-containing CAD1-like protein [Gossypium australe]
MGETENGYSPATHTAMNAVQAIGKGFDVNFDTRLLYCKGVTGSKIVEIDEEHGRDIYLYDQTVLPNVSRDIKNSQEPIGRLSSGVFNFNEMVEYFNKNANVSGSFPLGSFNSAFSFTGSTNINAATTKTLSMDGFYIPIAKFHLTKSPLVLQENVKQAVPTSWDPSSLSRVNTSFELYRVLILAFSSVKGYTLNLPMCHLLMGKRYLDDVTVIFRRRGGDDLEQNHTQWAKTVQSSPDVIEMTFYPITALLDGVAGKEHLIRAISLYLEYKPPMEELRYFLEFQTPRIWAPIQGTIPGHQRKEPICPSLRFSMMGQKLYVSQEQISVGRKPVTGLRLCLEGIKQNRLSIHLQYLVSLPKILLPHWDTHVAIGAPKWLGPEEQDSRWFVPVKWKSFAHVSTAPIENPESSIGDLSGVYIVTGAQLGVWDFGSRNVLYMKLLYSRIPGCTLRRSFWDHTPDDKPKKVVATVGSSGSDGNIVNKLAKFVDMSEMSKGPQDPPGHWLVTGGKLGVEKGKIVLRVKYSLLNY